MLIRAIAAWAVVSVLEGSYFMLFCSPFWFACFALPEKRFGTFPSSQASSGDNVPLMHPHARWLRALTDWCRLVTLVIGPYQRSWLHDPPRADSGSVCSRKLCCHPELLWVHLLGFVLVAEWLVNRFRKASCTSFGLCDLTLPRQVKANRCTSACGED